MTTSRLAAALGAAFLMLTVGCSSGPAAAVTTATCPQVIAHRTAPLDAPENTVPGIAAAAKQGATTVEVDVQWSASGYPVLMHDPTVDRTTNGTGTVTKLGLNYIVGLNAADYAPWKNDPRFKDVKVPYAWDFLNAAKVNGVDLLLDIKATPTRAEMDKLVEYVDRFSYRQHLLLMNNPAAVATMHGWYPDLKYMVIEYPPAGMIRIASTIAGTGATAYAVPWDRITASAVGYYRANGLAVYTWTSDLPAYDKAANWDALTADGVAAIITNDADGLIANQGCP